MKLSVTFVFVLVEPRAPWRFVLMTSALLKSLLKQFWLERKFDLLALMIQRAHKSLILLHVIRINCHHCPATLLLRGPATCQYLISLIVSPDYVLLKAWSLPIDCKSYCRHVNIDPHWSITWHFTVGENDAENGIIWKEEWKKSNLLGSLSKKSMLFGKKFLFWGVRGISHHNNITLALLLHPSSPGQMFLLFNTNKPPDS